jgi:tetratricopeptide (TPR) repeat protein
MFDPPRRATVLAIGTACLMATVLPAARAGAQKSGDKGKAAPKCQIDDNTPAELFSAKLFLQKAQAAKTDTAEQTKEFTAVVGQLTGKNAKINNPRGREYVLAQAFVGLSVRPGLNPIGTKGSFGFKDDTAATIDLLDATDTLMTSFAANKPDCAETADAIRQGAYVPLVNAAIASLNHKSIDTAALLATRAASIYPRGAYSYYVLGTVALTKKDPATAASQYQKTLDAIGTDTADAKLKVQVLYNQGVAYQQQAAAATGADKTAAAKKAAHAFKQVLALDPSDVNAKAAYAASLQASGDTAALTATYADMLANPTKYTDLELFSAAITAAQAQRTKDADTLFALGLVQNPYYPDAINYVANDLFNNKQTERLLPLARQLIALTPNNADAYRLLAGAYQLRSKDDKTPAAKKVDSDSTLKYYTTYKTLPVEVQISQFAHGTNTIVVSGAVVNKGTAAKSAGVTFSLLDKTGQVVATQVVPPVSIAPGASQPFTFTVTGTGIAGYKYAPVD